MKIALIGYGKMGKTIEDLAAEDDRGHEFMLKITSENIDELTTENLQKADAAIEFSTPEAAFGNIKKCIEAGVPVVSGTTGWKDRLDEMCQLCKDQNGAFLYASNFSIGVNIFFEINRHLAGIMNRQKEYQPVVEETHHTEKKDAPSGTAISLAEDMISLLDNKSSWVNNETKDKNKLSIISYREENVPGTHIINYNSDVDTIEIKHTAHSRKGFARGALLAAEWLKDKKGCFTMKDVLQLS